MGKTITSFELWRGASRLTDQPIVILASGVGLPSLNPKTGAMVQVYYLRADKSPGDAVRDADTRAICGECTHAPHRDGTCYVNPAYGAHQLWLSWKRGDCPPLPRTAWTKKFERRNLRIGAYGDPASAPSEVSRDLADSAAGHTGYTHAWRDRPELKAICMASVSSDAERLEAEALGWRAFQVIPMDKGTLEYLQPVARQLAVCGASIEKGKRTTCIECGACAGLASKARASIAVGAHGSASIKFAGLRGLGRDAELYPRHEPRPALPAGGAWGFIP